MCRNLVGSTYGSCFRNRPIRNKNCLWRPCLLTDQNRMSNSHRGPSIDASYHVSVHLAKLFQSRRFCPNLLTNMATVSVHLAKQVQRKSCFRNRTKRNKNCLWWPCLLTDQNRMSNSHRGHSIDASYQVSLTQLGQIDRNLVGSIYGMSSMGIAHSVLIR
jgi:hypothetical protein